MTSVTLGLGHWVLGGMLTSLATIYAANDYVTKECEQMRKSLTARLKQQSKHEDYGFWEVYLVPTKDKARAARLDFARIAYAERHPFCYLWNKALALPMTDLDYSEYKLLKATIRAEEQPRSA
jgi:hypothetical protein